MSPSPPEFILRLQARVADSISRTAIPRNAPEGLTSSCRYALNAGGKHIRPVLALCAADACAGAAHGTDLDAVVSALELIHTYSLIHDDLPAMDDDVLRRGKPTLHVAYDEATAILVGDGLQARAFELLANAPEFSADQRIRMVQVLSQASGVEGMVGGQYVDIQAVNTNLSLDSLQEMHRKKTGALIQASLALGGIAVDGTETQLTALAAYGGHIGLAFQVVDDVLDVEGSAATLGKTQGKDADANKPTYVQLLGLDGAVAEAHRLLQAALDALETFDASANQLRALARYIVERDR